MSRCRNQFVGRSGSALILAVVLVTLLAIVGVAFLLMSRVDRIATSAIADNMELEAAVESLLTRISDELVLDTPGVAGQEYQDYPGPEPDDPNRYYGDRWLASLEPNDVDGDPDTIDYYWQQISDVTGYLRSRCIADGNEWSTNRVAFDETTGIIRDSDPIVFDDVNGLLLPQFADADGDGVADSKWIEVEDVFSRKGKNLYAAVRIIDNGAMLNVNTGFKFDPTDPNTPAGQVDGSSLLQVNLMALSTRPPAASPYDSDLETFLLEARANPYFGLDPCNLTAYEKNAIWRYPAPFGPYSLFDISDELEFRYRYVLNHENVATRLEELGKATDLWAWPFRRGQMETPITNSDRLRKWYAHVRESGLYDPDIDPNYAYRHIATTHSLDRIINPDGGRMANINLDSIDVLYNTMYRALEPNIPNESTRSALAAQLAVNAIDYRDVDINVTAWAPPAPNAVTCYGVEVQPFISEIGYRISASNADNPSNNYFAIELTNPYDVDIPLADFYLQLRKPDPNGTIVHNINLVTAFVDRIGAHSRIVVGNSNTALTNLSTSGASKADPNLVLATYILDPNWEGPPEPPSYLLSETFDICLVRTVPSTSTNQIVLDRQILDRTWFAWSTSRSDRNWYRGRSELNWNIVYQTMAPVTGTLGKVNEINGNRENYNLSRGDRSYVTVGDLARILRIGPNNEPNNTIGAWVADEPNEGVIRFDAHDTDLGKIFNYVTVFDPGHDGLDNDLDGSIDARDTVGYEWKIPGRININTAPWFVMMQLPWVDLYNPLDPTNPVTRRETGLARGIVTHRDQKTDGIGFTSIAELMKVQFMDFYALLPADLPGFPDLTPEDTAGQDFEERDIIFSRISNLVTVRSDVFTAYIVVRLGETGPQKRVIAILDRSDVYDKNGKVKIYAYQVVPDPR